MKRFIAITCGALLSTCLMAQVPQPMSFEVATIKPVGPNSNQVMGIEIAPSGRLLIRGTSLLGLILSAYDIGLWQLKDYSGWIQDANFNVEAVPPVADAAHAYSTGHSVFWTIDDPQLKAMLQSLLKERFGLVMEKHTKTAQVLALRRNGKALQLKKEDTGDLSADATGEVSRVSGEGWMLFHTSMPQLARFVGAYVLHRKVIDRTGLTGTYNFRSALTQSASDFKSPDLVDTFMPALQEMGFKLQPEAGEVEEYRIVAAHLPTEN